MIAEDWLYEWQSLPFAVHGCWSFAQYLEWRLDRDPDDLFDLAFDDTDAPDSRPGPLKWQEVAAGATSFADLLATGASPAGGAPR